MYLLKNQNLRITQWLPNNERNLHRFLSNIKRFPNKEFYKNVSITFQYTLIWNAKWYQFGWCCMSKSKPIALYMTKRNNNSIGILNNLFLSTWLYLEVTLLKVRETFCTVDTFCALVSINQLQRRWHLSLRSFLLTFICKLVYTYLQ